MPMWQHLQLPDVTGLGSCNPKTFNGSSVKQPEKQSRWRNVRLVILGFKIAVILVEAVLSWDGK